MRFFSALLLLFMVAGPAAAAPFGEVERRAYCRYQSEVDRIVRQSWEVFGPPKPGHQLQPSDSVVLQETAPLVPVLDVSDYTFEELAVRWREVIDLSPGVEVVVTARRKRSGGSMMYEVNVPSLGAQGFIHPDSFGFLGRQAPAEGDNEASAWRSTRYNQARAAVLPGIDFGALQNHALDEGWHKSCD
jgi:hypothetical protein